MVMSALDRVVCELRFRCGEVKGYGSGVLIAPGLILTSHHLFREQSGSTPVINIRLGIVARNQSWLSAQLVWFDEALDAALVRLENVEESHPLRFAKLGQQPLDCRVLGYPAATDSADQRFNDSIDLQAQVRPLTFAREGKAALSIQSAVPEDKAQWRGLSGGPVLSGKSLLGIVLAFTHPFGADLLKVLPINRLLDNSSFCQLLDETLGGKLSGLIDEPTVPGLAVEPVFMTELGNKHALLREHGVHCYTFHKFVWLFELVPGYIHRCFDTLNPGFGLMVERQFKALVAQQVQQPTQAASVLQCVENDPVLAAAARLASEMAAPSVSICHYFVALLQDQDAKTTLGLRKGIERKFPGGFDRVIQAAIDNMPSETRLTTVIKSFQF